MNMTLNRQEGNVLKYFGVKTTDGKTQGCLLTL